jgi:hypothetical protein
VHNCRRPCLPQTHHSGTVQVAVSPTLRCRFECCMTILPNSIRHSRMLRSYWVSWTRRTNCLVEAGTSRFRLHDDLEPIGPERWSTDSPYQMFADPTMLETCRWTWVVSGFHTDAAKGTMHAAEHNAMPSATSAARFNKTGPSRSARRRGGFTYSRSCGGYSVQYDLAATAACAS